MARKAPAKDDKLPDAEAKARFQATLGKLVSTPHKPHGPLKPAKPMGAKD
jgi:hypothetical protein